MKSPFRITLVVPAAMAAAGCRRIDPRGLVD